MPETQESGDREKDVTVDRMYGSRRFEESDKEEDREKEVRVKIKRQQERQTERGRGIEKAFKEPVSGPVTRCRKASERWRYVFVSVFRDGDGPVLSYVFCST